MYMDKGILDFKLNWHKNPNMTVRNIHPDYSWNAAILHVLHETISPMSKVSQSELWLGFENKNETIAFLFNDIYDFIWNNDRNGKMIEKLDKYK